MFASKTTAVDAELEPAVGLDAEENQGIACRHRLPRSLDGATDGVSGILRQDQNVGLLPGDDHLVAMGPCS